MAPATEDLDVGAASRRRTHLDQQFSRTGIRDFHFAELHPFAAEEVDG